MAGTSDLSFIEFEGFFPPRTKPAIVIGFGENHGTKHLCIRTIAIGAHSERWRPNSVAGNLKDSGGRRCEQPGREFQALGVGEGHKGTAWPWFSGHLFPPKWD